MVNVLRVVSKIRKDNLWIFKKLKKHRTIELLVVKKFLGYAQISKNFSKKNLEMGLKFDPLIPHGYFALPFD